MMTCRMILQTQYLYVFLLYDIVWFMCRVEHSCAGEKKDNLLENSKFHFLKVSEPNSEPESL